MEEFFKAIEDRIRSAGYTKSVDGSEIYDTISDEIEDKDNGTYIFMSNDGNGTTFEYKVDVLDESFNLVYVRITDETGTYQANYDD